MSHWVCSTCGSDAVFFDAWVGANDPTDLRVFDQAYCDDCGGETSLDDSEDWAKPEGIPRPEF